jgi:hypothetical protein
MYVTEKLFPYVPATNFFYNLQMVQWPVYCPQVIFVDDTPDHIRVSLPEDASLLRKTQNFEMLVLVSENLKRLKITSVLTRVHVSICTQGSKCHPEEADGSNSVPVETFDY